MTIQFPLQGPLLFLKFFVFVPGKQVTGPGRLVSVAGLPESLAERGLRFVPGCRERGEPVRESLPRAPESFAGRRERGSGAGCRCLRRFSPAFGVCLFQTERVPGLPRLVKKRLSPVPLRGQRPDFLQEFLCLFRFRLPPVRRAGKDSGGVRRGRAFRKNDLARSRSG